MIRARSPLFFPTLIAVVVFACGFFALQETRFQPPHYNLVWRTVPAVTAIVRSNATLAMLVFGTLAAVLIVVQIAVMAGWEPAVLQRSVLGAVVVEKEQQGAGGWIVVAVPDQGPMRFEADAGEFAGVNEGDVVHLRVIGQYVASYRVVTGDSADRLRAGVMAPDAKKAWLREGWLQRPTSGGCGWLWIYALPLGAAYFFNQGILNVAYRQALASSGSRYNRTHYLVEGPVAVVQGSFMLAIGAILLGFAFVLWRVGWNSDTFRRRYTYSRRIGLPDDYL